MKIEQFILDKLEELVKKGSDREDLKEFLPSIKESFSKIAGKGPDDVIKSLSEQVIERSQLYMSAKTGIDELYAENELYVTALSTCIYLPSLDGSYKLKFLGGTTSDGLDVNDETKFDIASITKLFTLLLTYKLVEYGYLSLDDQISKLDSRYSGLKDFTIRDILLMHGKIFTDGKADDETSVTKAWDVMRTAKLVSDDRQNNLYTDIGVIILSNVIEQVVSKKDGRTKNYSEIMDEYLFKPFGLTNTVFNPENYNLAGNGNKLGLVHDPKARILGGMVGSAGIFTNADDLAKLAKEMYMVSYVNYNYIRNLVSKDNLLEMGTIKFPNSVQSNKGIVGLYQKHPDRENKWLCPLAYAENTFTSQGFTGATVTFDQQNALHNSFLINAIGDGKKAKPKVFLATFGKYQRYIVCKTLELLLIKEYYKLLGVNEEVTKTYKI